MLFLLAFGAVAEAVSLFDPWICRSSEAQPLDSPKPFRWRVPKNSEEVVRSSLPFEGRVEPEDVRGLIVVFVGAALLLHLARSILRFQDELKGGTVVDVRGKEILIERDQVLPGGTIVIVSKTGATFHERKEFGSPADLVSAIQGKK